MADSLPPSVTMETGPLLCLKCGRQLSPFTIEEIAGLTQLRAGHVLIIKIEARCLDCQKDFSWNIREKDVEKMTLTYQLLLKKIAIYTPE